MNLLHLVDRLEELVGGAQRMPIGSRVMIDRRRLLDLVNQMRVAVPQEVRDAQRMVSDRERLRREAEEEARLIVARAEEQATRLVSEHEITRQAERHAEDLARQAESRLEERVSRANADIADRIAESRRPAEQQMRAADDYARELLQRLARQLQAFVRSVDSGISQLEPPPAQSSPWDGLVGTLAVGEPRGARPAADTGADEVDEEDDELDDDWDARGRARDIDGASAGRRTAIAPAPVRRADEERERELPPPAPGVIDDFSLPALDDERAGDGDAGPPPDVDRWRR